jgi:hypothetical protein
MNRKLCWALSAGLAGTTLLAVALVVAQAAPASRLAPVAKTPTPARPADLGKRDIEGPAENLVATKTAAADAGNPKVQPGKVRWHANLETACKAAAKSAKPVLVFHMMGKLDDRFC